MTILSEDMVMGLQRLLSPEALQEAARRSPGSQGVSRHTAYRHWPHRGQALVDVATHLAENPAEDALDVIPRPEHYGVGDGSTPTPSGQSGQAREPDVDAARTAALDRFRLVIGTSLEMQLDSSSLVANWVLQTAATTSSPMWRGPRPDSDAVQVGRSILEARATAYGEAVARWTGPVRHALAELGRRPRPEFSVESITGLLIQMYEGCLLQLFVNPQLNEPSIDENQRRHRVREALDLISLAMFELAWAFSEPATLADPRRPAYDPEGETTGMFDKVVDAALQLYATASDEAVTPATAATQVNVPIQAALVMFPGPGDLADSALRCLVTATGDALPPSTKVNPLPIVRTVLAQLSAAATSHPGLIDAVRTHTPTHPPDCEPLLDELTNAVTDALRAPQLECRDPERTARRLVSFALEGKAGWSAVDAIIELLTPA